MENSELKEVSIPTSKNSKLKPDTGLAEQDRKNVAQKLQGILADSYLLMLKTHFYHWNVKGRLFKSLHDLTEEQYTELFEAIDELAERIRALGHEAPGTFSHYSELSNITDAKSGLSDLEMTADLLKSHEEITGRLRKVLKAADDAKDEVTIDMMVQRLTVHEKYAWMLRSIIEK